LKKVLRLTFKDAVGKSASISLNDPKPALTDLEVKTAMDTVINQNIFATANGDYLTKSKAQVITTEVQEFNLDA
jgi:hypothetical protein